MVGSSFWGGDSNDYLRSTVFNDWFRIARCYHLLKRRNRLSGISALVFYIKFSSPIFILRFCEIQVNFRNCLEPTKAPAQMSESLILVITLLKEELSRATYYCSKGYNVRFIRLSLLFRGQLATAQCQSAWFIVLRFSEKHYITPS